MHLTKLLSTCLRGIRLPFLAYRCFHDRFPLFRFLEFSSQNIVIGHTLSQRRQMSRVKGRLVLSNRAPTVDILTGSIEYLLHVEDKIRCGKEIFAIDDADWNCRSGGVDYEFVRVYSVHRAEYREYSCPVRECNW